MRNPRLDALPPFTFERLRALLGDAPAPAGVTPIWMTKGEPQHPPPPLLAQVLAENAHLWNRYIPAAGTPEIRAAIADWLRWRYRLGPGDALDPDRHILPVAGTREALYLFAQLVVPPTKGGRRSAVVLPNPLYQTYAAGVASAGAEAVYLPATAASGFLPDYAALAPEVLARAALIYACSPANPQGSVASLEYLQRLIELARAHGCALAVDECYADIYDRDPPPSALEAASALGAGFDGVMVFHSLSKRSNAAGLRSGFVAGDPALIESFRAFRAYACPLQPGPVLAASAALWRDRAHVEENRRRYRKKIDIAEQILGGRLGFYRPPGGFFLWLEVGDGEDATRRLWTEAGLGVVPGAYLAHDVPGEPNPGARYIRLALVHDDDTIRDALTRLAAVLA